MREHEPKRNACRDSQKPSASLPEPTRSILFFGFLALAASADPIEDWHRSAVAAGSSEFLRFLLVLDASVVSVVNRCETLGTNDVIPNKGRAAPRCMSSDRR